MAEDLTDNFFDFLATEPNDLLESICTVYAEAKRIGSVYREVKQIGVTRFRGFL